MMSTKFPFFIGLLLLASFSASAQPRAGQGGAPAAGSISGVVVDGADDQGIATATVAVWSAADSSLVTGSISDAKGRFTVEQLRPGSYYLQVSFIGYATRTIPNIAIVSGVQKVDAGHIGLTADTEMMDEVQVVAERNFVEVGIDRTVYNTKDQIVSAGGSASDVLQNIPSVEVDMEGQVSLRGNQNVAILINGRPSPVRGSALAGFLQGLPANSVERVEVIPNPSARYEPDGMAGILNIVLKKDVNRGLNGSASAGIASNEAYNTTASVNFARGAFNVFGNYGFRVDNRNGNSALFRENRFRDPLTYLDQSELETRSSRSHVLNTTIDYSIDPLATISLTSLFSTRPERENEVMDFLTSGSDNLALDRFNRVALNEETDFSTDQTLAFRRVKDPSRDELVVEARFGINTESEFGRFTEQDRLLPDLALRELQHNDVDSRQTSGSLQIDYVKPFLGGKVETGYKGSLRGLNNAFFSETLDEASSEFLPDLNLNNAFLYVDQIHAAYGTFGRDFGRLGFQGGIRLEQAFTQFDLETTNEQYENDYFSAFPSAFFTFKVTPTQTLKASYSKRINRPGTWQLNPFASTEDPLNRRVGNPYLRPEYVHAFEAGYTRFSPKTTMTVTPYFRRTVDEMRRWVTVDDNGVATMTFENFDTSDSYGLETIGTLQVKGRFNAFAAFNAYQVVTDGSSVQADLSNKAFGWNTRINATFSILRSLDLQVSYFYRAPMNIENGRIGAFSMTNVALRQKLLGDRADLSLRMNDPFDQSGFSLQRGDDRFYVELDRRWQSRTALMTFTYNFGERQGPTQNRRRDNQDRANDRVDMDF